MINSERVNWPLLRPVLIFHLATRAAIVVGLLVAAGLSGRPIVSVLTRWDGRWYERLARYGYPTRLPVDASGSVAANTAAFFDLFPLLTKPFTALGVPFWLSAMIINLLASSAAVLIIVLVGLAYLDRCAAVLLGYLWSAFPLSVALTVPYTEAVFTVAAAASLLFVLRRRWLLAGLCAAVAGTVRSPGIIFAGAVGLGALEAIVRRREWRSLIGAIIAPLGFLASVGYIGLRTGRLNAWQLTEHGGWHSRLTFGTGWPGFFTASPSAPHWFPHLLTGILAAVLFALTIAAIALRPPLPIIGLLVVGGFTAFAFGGVEMDSAPRIMMSFFPVLAPAAVLMARLPIAVRWALLGLAALLAAVIGGYYFAFSPISP